MIRSRCLVSQSILILALLVTCATAQTPTAELTELHFGIISTETSKALKEGFEPWLADMAQFLGIPVKGFYAPDYAGVIEAMRFGKVHVAWFGNKSALEAVTRADGEVCAQTVDIHGNPGYWSLIVAHKDSPYNTIEEIIAAGKKLKFGNGDPNSTSGFLVPAYYLWAPRGLDPNTHFGMVRTANHETNLLAIVNKQIDFATNNTESLQRLKEKDTPAHAQIKIIWQSPLIPSDPIVWRQDLSREMKSKLKSFFLSYGRSGPDAARQREVLAKVSSGWAPFHDSNNAQLLPIRELDLVKDKLKLENSNSLSTDEKQTKIAVIDKELAELQQYRTLLEKFH